MKTQFTKRCGNEPAKQDGEDTACWSSDVDGDFSDDTGRKYNVVFICSMRVNPGVLLVGNKKYPEIAQDFEKGFAALKNLPCDVFVAAHGNQFGMIERIKRMEQDPKTNPFIDPQGYRDYIVKYEAAFREELQKQKAAARQ